VPGGSFPSPHGGYCPNSGDPHVGDRTEDSADHRQQAERVEDEGQKGTHAGDRSRHTLRLEFEGKVGSAMAKTKNATLSTDALKPYVQRAMNDPELREDLLAAFVAARGIYDQMSKGRGIKGKAEKATDKDVQKQLQKLVEDLSEASDKFKGKKSHKARNRILLLTGVTLGVLYNPWTGQSTRDWIMDQVSGSDSNGLEQLDAELAADSAAGNGSSEAL